MQSNKTQIGMRKASPPNVFDLFKLQDFVRRMHTVRERTEKKNEKLNILPDPARPANHCSVCELGLRTRPAISACYSGTAWPGCAARYTRAAHRNTKLHPPRAGCSAAELDSYCVFSSRLVQCGGSVCGFFSVSSRYVRQSILSASVRQW